MLHSKFLLNSSFVTLALLSLASATPTKPDPDADLDVQPAPDTGTVFAVYPGWDMNNGDANLTLGGTELACLQTCSTDPTCIAYSYSPYESGGTPVQPACFLKTSLDLSTFQIRQVDVSVGLVGACGTFAPVGPTSCFTVTVPA